MLCKPHTGTFFTSTLGVMLGFLLGASNLWAKPTLLVIGDSISLGYETPLADYLSPKATVSHNEGNAGPSSKGRDQSDDWLQQADPEFVLFNFGLHDIKSSDGKLLTSKKEYEENLKAIIQSFKARGITAIWVTTTPVPPGDLNHGRKDENVVSYNKIAAKVMADNKIPVIDLYAFVLPRLKKLQKPRNVHFTDDGYRKIARFLADEIATYLD